MWYDKLQNHIDYAYHQDRVQTNLDKIVLDKTKITSKMLDDKRKDDWFMLYDEAIKLEVIHGEI